MKHTDHSKGFPMSGPNFVEHDGKVRLAFLCDDGKLNMIGLFWEKMRGKVNEIGERSEKKEKTLLHKQKILYGSSFITGAGVCVGKFHSDAGGRAGC